MYGIRCLSRSVFSHKVITKFVNLITIFVLHFVCNTHYHISTAYNICFTNTLIEMLIDIFGLLCSSAMLNPDYLPHSKPNILLILVSPHFSYNVMKSWYYMPSTPI